MYDRNEYHRFECKPMLKQIKEERNNGAIRSFILITALVGIFLYFM